MSDPTPSRPRPNPKDTNTFRGHPAGLDDDALLKQCTVHRTKASGPGGQHRNKTDSAVILTHTPTGIAASATERRSQHANHREALKRLRLKLAVEHRPRDLPDPSQPPSDLWRSRVKARRLVLSADHADFPTLLAEALDTLAALGYDHTKAAVVLGVTPSQLVKLFQKEPAAMAMINARRVELGMHALK